MIYIYYYYLDDYLPTHLVSKTFQFSNHTKKKKLEPFKYYEYKVIIILQLNYILLCFYNVFQNINIYYNPK
jgi:hypothetical protein